jgi:hypothetical protein
MASRPGVAHDRPGAALQHHVVDDDVAAGDVEQGPAVGLQHRATDAVQRDVVVDDVAGAVAARADEHGVAGVGGGEGVGEGVLQAAIDDRLPGGAHAARDAMADAGLAGGVGGVAPGVGAA